MEIEFKLSQWRAVSYKTRSLYLSVLCGLHLRLDALSTGLLLLQLLEGEHSFPEWCDERVQLLCALVVGLSERVHRVLVCDVKPVELVAVRSLRTQLCTAVALTLVVHSRLPLRLSLQQLAVQLLHQGLQQRVSRVHSSHFIIHDTRYKLSLSKWIYNLHPTWTGVRARRWKPSGRERLGEGVKNVV